MCPDSALTSGTEPPPSHDYFVFEGLEVLTVIRAGLPLYLGASEQLWIQEDRWISDEPAPCKAHTVEVMRAITAVDGRSVPSLWRPSGYHPCRSPDILALLGGREPGNPPRGFRCACGRVKLILYRWPQGGYVCHRCRKAKRRRGSTTPGGPLVLEDEGRRFVLAAFPTRYAPDLVPFELVEEGWRGQSGRLLTGAPQGMVGVW